MELGSDREWTEVSSPVVYAFPFPFCCFKKRSREVAELTRGFIALQRMKQ